MSFGTGHNLAGGRGWEGGMIWGSHIFEPEKKRGGGGFIKYYRYRGGHLFLVVIILIYTQTLFELYCTISYVQIIKQQLNKIDY